jgi:hypothetical protein
MEEMPMEEDRDSQPDRPQDQDAGQPGVPDMEEDSRFPSGPWKGFFLQPVLTGRHWMELSLTFRRGVIRGEGRDWVGTFSFRGRYEVETGKCWWTKQYLGRHALHYQGYNEGKGIWGTWDWPGAPTWRGGFHIWPVAMGDPTQRRLAEAVDEPVTAVVETLEVAGAEST